MSVEEELKKDHAEMQAAVDSKQKIIDAQVGALATVLQSLGWCEYDQLLSSSLVAPQCKNCGLEPRSLCSEDADQGLMGVEWAGLGR